MSDFEPLPQPLVHEIEQVHSSARIQRGAGRFAAVAAAFAVVSFLVLDSSQAAFVANTVNINNQVSTGAVALADNDSAAAMFNNLSLSAGASRTSCITVNYTGTLGGAVKLHRNAAFTGNLLTHVNLKIEEASTDQGSAGTFSDCASFAGSEIYNGTLSGFSTASTSYATGIGSWTPATSGTASNIYRRYRFTIEVQSTAPQSETANFGFQWSIESN